jgi:hypothetical protein
MEVADGLLTGEAFIGGIEDAAEVGHGSPNLLKGSLNHVVRSQCLKYDS